MFRILILALSIINFPFSIAFAQYPVQMGMPFECGKIRNPVIKGVPTQTSVKVLCPDGTTRHAILNFISNAKSKEITRPAIVEGKTVAGMGPTFIPDVAMEITTPIDGKTRRWTAKDFTGAKWIDGPIATTTIYEDRRSPDQFRPAFHVTRWHGLNKTQVRFVGNNDNAGAVAELWVGVKLFADGKEIYSKAAFPMPRASRWSKTIWTTGPPPQANVRFDLPYLIRTKAVPNYDTSIKVNQSAVDAMCKQWQIATKDLTDVGNWTKAMGAAGGRADIGPYPTWAVLWLYTNDNCMREMTLGNADLAASWTTHFRQGDGQYYSIEDNPGSQLLNLVGVTKVGDTDQWGWVPDLSHQPAPFYIPYLLTGDYFYLEELFFWASWSAAYSNGAAINSGCGRGPTGKEGGIPGSNCISIRGQAWALRNRAEAAWIAPSDTAERKYFARLTTEALKIFEGERGIGDLSDPLRAWGARVNPQSNPLHWWEIGNNNFWQEPLNPALGQNAISGFEHNFIGYALRRTAELDFPAQPLIDWHFANVKALMALDPRWSAAYRWPTQKPDGNFFTMAELPAQYVPTFDLEKEWQAQTANGDHGYGIVAIPAGNLTAIAAPALRDNPKWAITPR